MKRTILLAIIIATGMTMYAQEMTPRERAQAAAAAAQAQSGNPQAGDRAAMMNDPAYQAKMDMMKGMNQVVHKEISGTYPGKSFKLTYVKVTIEPNNITRTEKRVEFFDEAKKKFTHTFTDEELMPLTKALGQMETSKEKYKPTMDSEVFFNSKSGFRIGYMGTGGSWVEFVEGKNDGVTVLLKVSTGTISELFKALTKKPEEDAK
jgi:hypothetical protein